MLTSHPIVLAFSTLVCGLVSGVKEAVRNAGIYKFVTLTDLGSAPKGGPPFDPLYDTKSCRAPHGIAAFARTYYTRMLVQFKGDFRFERQARAFQNDFWTKFISHVVFSDVRVISVYPGFDLEIVGVYRRVSPDDAELSFYYIGHFLITRSNSMNNNLYHWHDEQMVRHEMQEVRRAVEQESLLRDAGLSKPGLLVRAAKALRTWLESRRERIQESALPAREAYPSRRDQGRDPFRDTGRSTD